VRRRWLSLCTVWPLHSKWLSEQISFISPFHSSHAGFYGKASHCPGLSALLQPRFGSLRLLAFPKAKIAVEREICECDCNTVHELSQRLLTADWLAPGESDCSRMHSRVSSDWRPSYIKSIRLVLEIFKMAGYFLDSTCWYHYLKGICLKMETAVFSETQVPVYQVTIHCCTGLHMSTSLCGILRCYVRLG